MNILLLASHQVAEYDDIRMFLGLGHDVYSPGGYENPAQVGESIRPAVDGLPDHSDLRAACIAKREQHGGEELNYAIDWAKADLPDEVIEWADVIICHHFPVPWLIVPWKRLKHKRVIWRTCGQSDPDLEWSVMPLRSGGLQIVRYSPQEKVGFEELGAFAGEDAVIRFGKDPEEWKGWTGEQPRVINITQRLYQRHPSTNWEYWEVATEGLRRVPVGEGSEHIGGAGKVDFDDMKVMLRENRAYLYTGTQPASYTLGLIEAMMTGIPTVSITPDWMRFPSLFEGDTITGNAYADPEKAKAELQHLLHDPVYAALVSQDMRERAIDLFDIGKIGAQWQAFLG